MTEKADSLGAVCLDGSPGAFYIRPSPPRTGAAKKWHLHLQGGGWCYDEPGCYNRSVFLVGSSLTLFPALANEFGGILSSNCTVNPTWCGFNRVVLAYCDGTSYSGDREKPVVYNAGNRSFPMWFRGKRILDAAIETLLQDYSLCAAEEVLLTGDSAGGMGVYLHADYIRNYLLKRSCQQGKFKFRAVPVSGFMVPRANVNHQDVWQEQMRYLYNMSNWTITSERCKLHFPEEQRWHCMFSAAAYRFVQVPIFVVNSALDLWQVQNILTAERISGFPREAPTVNYFSGYNSSAVAGWHDCAYWGDVAVCSAAEVSVLNSWMDHFLRALTTSTTFSQVGNGAFVYGCYTHDDELDDEAYVTVRLRDATMREAASAWWKDAALPAAAHTWIERGRYSYPAHRQSISPTCKLSPERAAGVPGQRRP